KTGGSSRQAVQSHRVPVGFRLSVSRPVRPEGLACGLTRGGGFCEGAVELRNGGFILLNHGNLLLTDQPQVGVCRTHKLLPKTCALFTLFRWQMNIPRYAPASCLR